MLKCFSSKGHVRHNFDLEKLEVVVAGVHAFTKVNLSIQLHFGAKRKNKKDS